MMDGVYNIYPLLGEWDFILMVNIPLDGYERYHLYYFCYWLGKIKGISYIYSLDLPEPLPPQKFAKFFREIENSSNSSISQ
ncbi:MAG: hypothetical protein DRN12_02260 [Thermoplasmata archaeon]|nr:MAG: hypothetical protein DRN12_02260 [Thermoplasmata archaeon]